MRSFSRLGAMAVAAIGLVALAATTASADTRIMPTRQALVGTAVIVWGNTSQANGTAFTLDCGNGTAPLSGTLGVPATVPERTYINTSCTYATANTFTATLTVGTEVATTNIAVVDPTVATAFDLRNTKVNMAIEDGLRYLYQAQGGSAATRASLFDTNMTYWSSSSTASDPNAFTALAILAMENHGHPFNGTDIYAPVVQRGLNYLFNNMVTINMSSDCGSANDPCQNVPAPTNIGLYASADGNNAYATPIFAAALAGAVNVGALTPVAAGLGASQVPANFVVGRTYAEILQRLVNGDSYGQIVGGTGNGGWYYSERCAGCQSDGSTLGWQMLGLIDSQAAGAVIPAFVKTRYTGLVAVGDQVNTDGTLDYRADGNAATGGSMTRVGITMQSMAFLGLPSSDSRIAAAEAYMVKNWTTQISGYDYGCGAGSPTTTNKGCGYAMFNNFKGLKAYGVVTLAGIGRPAGPGSIAADDWYADYVDNLLTNQHLTTSAIGGSWDQSANPTMGWSCCESNPVGITSLAELILSPVAFVLPDPILFSTVGLSPNGAVNPENTSHTVTAFAQSSNNQPVPGATINFVVSGLNAGATGLCNPASCITGADGKVSFTYTDTKGVGGDTIQAFIGTLGSNVVTKSWIIPTIKCDANGDGVVTVADLRIIAAANGQVATGPTDPRDGNSDGVINVADARYCQLRLGQTATP